jgi:hypothetical protein
MGWIKKQYVLLVCNIFIFLFVYTALSKLHEFNLFKSVLQKSPLIGTKSEIVAVLLPAIEILFASFLFIPKTRKMGLYSTSILMSIFTIYIGYMILFTPHLPCSCGGVLKQMTWKQHLIFNLVFTAVSLLAIVMDSKYPSPGKQTTNPYPTGYS